MLIAQVWEKFSLGYQLLNFISKGYHEAFILWKQMRENHSLYKLYVGLWWVSSQVLSYFKTVKISGPWHVDIIKKWVLDGMDLTLD